MIVFELLGLMLTALRSAVLVSKALDLRLTPLNKDRAFVAEMLVRSVFELGDSENNDLGVDAGGGEEAVTRPILVNVAAVLWIKGRVLITGTLFKFFTKMGFNWDAATWLAPWTGPTLAAMLWDAMLCHAIMKGAEVQAIGVTTSVEVGAHAYAHTHAQAHTQHPTLCPPLNLSTDPHSPFVLFCLSRWVP
jgi:hypothetical protein